MDEITNLADSKEKWDAKISTASEDDRVAMEIYSTESYFDAGWGHVAHGMLILDDNGVIVDANPFFCLKMNLLRREIKGLNIHDFCVLADDLTNSDYINVYSLLQNRSVKVMNTCNLKDQENKLFRVKWVAHRIPSNLKYQFIHSVVHVYFISESSFDKMKRLVEHEEDKENANALIRFITKFFDSTAGKAFIFLVLILTAVGGSLPSLIEKLLMLF